VSEHAGRVPLSAVLGLLCVAAIVVAYTTVGRASTATAQSRRTATVARGVVQSTVSGSGNLQAASELDLGFKTSGVVTHIYVKQGEHVHKGQLLAAVDPQSAESRSNRPRRACCPQRQASRASARRRAKRRSPP